MNENFPSSERLKSKILIDRLFSEGRSLKKFPIKLIYLPIKDPANASNKTGVSVPKRIFKKAVDRNHLKRLMRECFRKNKYLVESNLAQKYALMFIYTSNKKISFNEMSVCISGVLQQLIKREGDHEKSDS